MSFTWPVDRTGYPALPTLDDPPSAEYIKAATERNAAENLAVRIMHALSGRQFGIFTATVRPCRAPLPSHQGIGPVTSYLLSWEGDRWATWRCGCAGGCRLTGPRAIHLLGPVHSVTEVRINGIELDSDLWTVENNVLYRSELMWPAQDLSRPLGEPNTWSVTYERGIPAPPEAASLTALLAKEFLAALANDSNCRLPRTVQVASRQGITYRAYDPATIYAKGKTGIPEIDLWLAAVNPHHLLEAPSVI